MRFKSAGGDNLKGHMSMALCTMEQNDASSMSADSPQLALGHSAC